MGRILCTILTALAILLSGAATDAGAASSSSSHRKVWVKGYVRKDGTYVPGHYRAAGGSATPRPIPGARPRPRVSGHPSSGRSPSPGAAHRGGPARCTTCSRDENGRIARSETARHEFMRRTGYPHGRPGYVVDHIVPLACGGSDTPSNMQWQTVADARAKDRTERRCVH